MAPFMLIGTGMSGKTGKRETAKKPSTTRRQSAKADGAFGEQKDTNRKAEVERNIDRAQDEPGTGGKKKTGR